MNTSIGCNTDLGKPCVAFYIKQGYTEPQSEILAEQLCSGCGRWDRITAERDYSVRKSGMSFHDHSLFQESLSLKDILNAIPDGPDDSRAQFASF